MDNNDDVVSACCAAVSIVCVLAMIAGAVLVAVAFAHTH